MIIKQGTMRLSNGTIVAGRPMDNGATEAVILPHDREMTEAEWKEFCLKLRSLPIDKRRQFNLSCYGE